VISFAFIWGGAGVFAAAALFRHRAAREALKRSAEPV
jgi:chloramphenicol-sensitive protein RarD